MEMCIRDRGMTTGDNIWYTINTPAKDGYVFSMSIRGADKSIKNYVLDENGYEWLGEEYKRKSRLYPRTISVTSNNGKKILYISGEESLKQIKLRANRMGQFSDNLSLLSETSLDIIESVILETKPDAVVIDSIQTCLLYTSNKKSI